jgi:hypothetical protein
VLVLVAYALGAAAVDLDADELLDDEPDTVPVAPLVDGVALPRLVAAARSGSTVVAVVDRKPPLLVSHDAGLTWREAGAGLPAGVAVAIADDDPDVIVFAGEERLFVSSDGGRFWRALTPELPGITAIGLA